VQAKKGLSLGHKKPDAINADHAQVLHSVLTQAESRAAAAAAAAAAGKKAKKLEPEFAGALSKLSGWLAQADAWCAGFGGSGGVGGGLGGGLNSRKRSCRTDEGNTYDYGGGNGGGARENEDDEDDDDEDHHDNGTGGGGGGGRTNRGGEKGRGDDNSGMPPPSSEMLKDWKYHVHLIRKIKTAQARHLKEELETAIELAISEPSVMK
jgi:hypothetical protein